MHNPRVYFNNIGSICTDRLRHGNGLSALLLLTRAAKSSAAKSSASKTRSMESRLTTAAALTLGPVLFRILANRTRRVDFASGLYSHYKRLTRRERYAPTSPCTHCVCFATGCNQCRRLASTRRPKADWFANGPTALPSCWPGCPTT